MMNTLYCSYQSLYLTMSVTLNKLSKILVNAAQQTNFHFVKKKKKFNNAII